MSHSRNRPDPLSQERAQDSSGAGVEWDGGRTMRVPWRSGEAASPGRSGEAASPGRSGEAASPGRSGEAASVERPVVAVPLTGTARQAEEPAPVEQVVEAEHAEGTLPARLFINRNFAIYTAGSFISA